MRRLRGINTVTALAVVIHALFSGCKLSSQSYPPSASPPNSNLLGQDCDPPFGFLRNVCGEEVLLEEVFVPGPIYLHGPNTCRVTRTVQRNEFDYTYQEYCYWVYSHSYYNYIWQCQVVCQPTSTCNTDRIQVFERSKFECCEGFQVRPANDPAHYEYIFRLHYTPVPTQPVGCPIAVGESILECLNILGLTDFIDTINQGGLLPLFNESSGLEFTLFAPTNEAFEAMGGQLPNNIDVDLLVGHHVVVDIVEEEDLAQNQRFMTFANTTLHSTTVVFADRSLYQYNPSYSRNNHHSSLIRYTNVRFIGGGRVVNPDACVTDGPTLHVIDRVLMPGNETIASILEGDPDFSQFTEALRFARVFDFLDKEDVSRTVYAPTDEAFNRQIPPDLFVCLMYMRLPLNDLVLFHIAESAEYTSSLSLRQFTYTLQRQPIRLMTDAQGNIIFQTNPPSSIIDANISAINGVIHVIDNVLIPPNMDYGECAEFVPTTPPPTTPPTTTMTTPPATTMTTPSDTTAPTLAIVTPGTPSMVPGPGGQPPSENPSIINFDENP